MCELQLTVGIMSRTALFKALCVKGGTHPRAQLEHLGIKPVQLIPEPMSTATEVFEQRFFRSTALSSP